MGDFQDRAERMRSRLDEQAPEAWKPTREGEEIIGLFRGLEGPKHDRHRGEVYVAVLELDPPSGRLVSVWLLHTALKNEFARKRPDVGSFVAIRYLGKQTPAGGGSAYDNYRVEVERQPGSAIAWDRIGDPEAEAELEVHAFEGVAAGVADRPCTRCGRPDRDPIHRVVAPPTTQVCPECRAFIGEGGPHESGCSHG